jgi:hypothetical protein
MLPQDVLGFLCEADRSSGGLSSLAGLPLYLDLIEASGHGAASRQHVHVARAQGWVDIQMVLSPAERRSLKQRWRPPRERAVPSPSAAYAWLGWSGFTTPPRRKPSEQLKAI